MDRRLPPMSVQLTEGKFPANDSSLHSPPTWLFGRLARSAEVYYTCAALLAPPREGPFTQPQPLTASLLAIILMTSPHVLQKEL
jgi:hypothetical protein